MTTRYIVLFVAGLVLAACDTPSPDEFHHKNPSATLTGTGTHLAGTSTGNVMTTTDTHQLESLPTGIGRNGG